ncbi:MAG TPA: bifunctional lysylphosphatidylglycerol synthetase/lysine--tRNA ligase LysX [Stackebrandtia sp.]|nr:bifunctional lysylphosphatidylglycerol synthetase/lysine--tRNA ligase LysX [Stackebrandtia sp.]HZE41212.1 bifunctional lysylphosphatidylglycerol synthetase/lysine--tRNA ligase LysX [Stackebrandtia sp.]
MAVGRIEGRRRLFSAAMGEGEAMGAKSAADRRADPVVGGWRARIPTVLAALMGAVALLVALGAVASAFRVRTAGVRDIVEWMLIPAPPNLAYAAFLLIFASAVARRKRVAWWILLLYFSLTLSILALLEVSMILAPRDFFGPSDLPTETPGYVVPRLVGATLTALAILILLLLGRRQFMARVGRGSLWRAIGVLIGLTTVFTLVGWGLLAIFHGTVRPDQRLQYTLEKVLGGAFRFQFLRTGYAPGWLDLLLGGFGAAAIFIALLTLFRSQREAAEMTVPDEVAIRALLAEYGEDDSLGYFATRRDKAVVFSLGRDAAVTYRVVAGVCLASGDPIGARSGWHAAIKKWQRMARSYGWAPAVLGASEEGAKAYQRAGLRVREIGDEAILLPREYTLDGREMRPVRQAVSRIERAGYIARIRRHGDLSGDDMARAIRNADDWRDTPNERGFSMALSRLGDVNDDDSVLVEAVDAGGEVRAMLSFAPWGARGLSLDLMRREREADNGLMEFMVTSLCREAGHLGVERISLNFAMFRSVFEEGARIGAGPILRLWRNLLSFFSRWWQLESLYRSNMKYRPYWEPRYLCYSERRMLGRVGFAAGAAEGFITVAFAKVSIGRDGLVRPLPGLDAALAGARARRDGRGRYERRPSEQTRVRLDKLRRLKEAGVDPYPVGFARTVSCGRIVREHGGLGPGAATGVVESVAGRVILLRRHGRLVFATIRDGDDDLQVMVTDDADFASTVDIGDHIGVTGQIVTSRLGELSIECAEWKLTAKCLHPLPNKHTGLSDPEARVRQRHLDLIMDPSARQALRTRGTILHELRNGLYDSDFLEVETPILQPVHGGANARPFVTHSNAYDLRLYLRIAPELYLKRLCVGGVEKVFEIGRTFRNEGTSFKHNPEFTMLEAYQAYADYHDMRELTARLVRRAARRALGTTVIERDGETVDLAADWPVVPVYRAVSRAIGEELDPGTPVDRLRGLCDAGKIPYDPQWDHGAIVLEMYERLVEHATTTPTFYTDFPASVSPLTRAHRDDERLAERWDLVAFGVEIGTAYSELTDPVEQRRRLTEQSLLAAGGDAEAMELDEDFLGALEYAMPPTGGLGLGVDRLVMLLTGRTIRQTLPFPLVRPTTPGAL